MSSLTLLDAAQRSGPVAKKWVKGEAPKSEGKAKGEGKREVAQERANVGGKRRLIYKSMEKK